MVNGNGEDMGVFVRNWSQGGRFQIMGCFAWFFLVRGIDGHKKRNGVDGSIPRRLPARKLEKTLLVPKNRCFGAGGITFRKGKRRRSSIVLVALACLRKNVECWFFLGGKSGYIRKEPGECKVGMGMVFVSPVSWNGTVLVF